MWRGWVLRKQLRQYPVYRQLLYRTEYQYLVYRQFLHGTEYKYLVYRQFLHGTEWWLGDYGELYHHLARAGYRDSHQCERADDRLCHELQWGERSHPGSA